MKGNEVDTVETEWMSGETANSGGQKAKWSGPMPSVAVRKVKLGGRKAAAAVGRKGMYNLCPLMARCRMGID